MTEFFDTLKGALPWIALGSVVILIASALALPWLVAWMPEDYFVSEKRPPSRFAGRHPAVRILVFVARNLFGAILILAGLAMLFLPGQGLLTIAAGMLLVDFPYKHQIERRIVGNEKVWRSINWLRAKARARPLIRPDGEPSK